ncbi:MAG: hypothetical protein GXZ08_08875 [Tissierellia bacterium]|nr:hypothetical protein [Tissierellia bacterium]
MYALFIVLNDLKKLDDVMLALYALDLGATSMDSSGMISSLTASIPDFLIPTTNDLKEDEKQAFSKTLVSIIHDEAKVDTAIERINKLLNIDENPGTAFMFVLPVLRTTGGFIEK